MNNTDFYGSKPSFTMSGRLYDGYWHIIDEELDKLDACPCREYCMEKKVIKNITDLSSFRPKKELNTDIWNEDGTIKSRVRLRLLDIADNFIEYLSVPWVKYKDIILTGSLANYNWSKYSDFDLHILIDFSKVDKRTDFVKEYFNAKKNEWNNQHEDLSIYGYSVELYVQDTQEEHNATGMYSLDKNKWLKEPEKDNIKAIKLDKFYIKEKTKSFIDKIDKLTEDYDKSDGEYEIREVSKKLNKLFDKLKELRSESLKKNGEMGSGNIIYKLIRRTGYLDKILDLKSKTYDKIMSLS